MPVVLDLFPDWTNQGEPESLAARPVANAAVVAMQNPIPQTVLDQQPTALFGLAENQYLYYAASEMRRGNFF
jgi:hypothetical protein